MANYSCKSFSLRPDAKSQYIRYRRRRTDRRRTTRTNSLIVT